MEDKYTRILNFFTACDELIGGSFMVAEKNIAGVLKSIAFSDELSDLLSAATETFDYNAAKRAYLRYPAEKGGTHGVAYLPSDRRETLAFVFCVLVELDAGVLKLNDFLLRYFYKDGSYTASFAVFTERMIRPFRDIIRGCFPDVGRKGYLEQMGKKKDGILEILSKKITEERARISAVALRDEEREAAGVIFPELLAAVGRKDTQEVLAILAGYRYFLAYINAETKESREIFELAYDL